MATRLQQNLTRIRGELRDQLTPGERAVFYVWTLLIILLPPSAGIVTVAGRGSTRTVGLVLLVATLVVFVFPMTRLLRARVQRREREG
jgi:tryptophan-rich sensory protein